jgi:hypothetical protein
MGTWGRYSYPTEPSGSDYEGDQWWDDWEARAEREMEWEAKPTYEELMVQYENEVNDD